MAWNEAETPTLVTDGYQCARCGAKYRERPSLCLSCWESGVVVPIFRRVLSEIAPRRGGMTAKALAAADQRVFASSHYPSLKLQKDAMIVLSGGPARGKLHVASVLRTISSLRCLFLLRWDSALHCRMPSVA